MQGTYSEKGELTVKINQLDAFIAIAEGHGVAGASDRLCVTQPAITKSISNLESELNIQLFERSSNRLKLNKYGKILLRRAKAAKAELTLAVDELELLKNQSKESIKFNGSPVVIPKLIPMAMHHFKKTHPHVQIELTGPIEDNPVYEIQALLNGQYDLLITGIDENKVNPGVVYEKLLDLEMVFFASKGHPALTLDNPTFRELGQYEWLFPATAGLPYQMLRAAFRRAVMDMPPNMLTVSNHQIIFSLLECGMYLAAMPYHPNCFERQLNELNTLPVQIEKIHWSIYLIRRENTIFSSAMNDFIEQLKHLVSIPQ